MHPQPTGAAFDVVLLLHVGCTVVGLATTGAAAATARALRRVLRKAAPIPDALHRYFQPGINWVGRAVYGIPVFGLALVGMSRGAYALGDGWVLAGIVLFAALAAVCESVLSGVQRSAPHEGDVAGDQAAVDTLSAAAALMARAAVVALVLLVAGTVVMVVQP